MFLTLDEYILVLWLNWAKTLPGPFGWRTVKMLVGFCTQAVAETIYCRYLQALAKYTAGLHYTLGTPGRGSGIDKVLTNDEWFVMLLVGGSDTRSAVDILQKLPQPIAVCQVIYDRWVDIHKRYEQGWRAPADPVSNANGV